MDPHDFGEHSYGKPSPKEKNGVLYTCRGGFIDFSHLRVAADWTVFLVFKMMCGEKSMELPCSDGTLKLDMQHTDDLPLEDLLSMAQKMAFERLVWHELCSWYYHLPNYTFNERQSTFTPEDTYSNFLGTVVGRNIALRILQKREGLPYAQVATEEIQKLVYTLLPVGSKKQSMMAYDRVDAAKQAKLPEAERNKDVWWDSRVVFTDERYVFKRYMDIGPRLEPWLVPGTGGTGCPGAKPKVLAVPQKTRSGKSFYGYYTLRFVPDSALFYDKNTHRKMYEPFAAFTGRDMQSIVDHVAREMEKELLPGFDRRNRLSPEKRYRKLRKVWFP